MKFHELFDQWLDTEPDRVFIYSRDQDITYRDLNTLIENVNLTRVRAGDRVLVIGENSVEYIATILAISRAGATFCGLNSRLTTGEIIRYQQKFDPRLTILTADASAQAHSIHTGISETSEPGDESTAAIIFSSGTTGEPKGIRISHDSIVAGAKSTVSTRHIDRNDRMLAYLPFVHAFGLSSVLVAALSSGARLILSDRFDPAVVFDLLANKGLSILQGPPTFYVKLLDWLDQYNISTPDCPALKYMYTGSSPLDLTLKQRIEQRFNQVLHNGYGLSEHVGIVAITEFGVKQIEITVGAPVVDTMLAEDNEILIKGPGLMQGYVNEPNIDNDLWFATGDIGQFHNGQLTIVARKKEVIKRSGFSVYPMEIESALNSYVGVAESAVAPRVDPNGLEQIYAYIKTNQSVDIAELRQHLKHNLAGYKIPTEIKIVEEFPRTDTGKIIKNLL